jgi:hypothetical protein
MSQCPAFQHCPSIFGSQTSVPIVVRGVPLASDLHSEGSLGIDAMGTGSDGWGFTSGGFWPARQVFPGQVFPGKRFFL